LQIVAHRADTDGERRQQVRFDPPDPADADTPDALGQQFGGGLVRQLVRPAIGKRDIDEGVKAVLCLPAQRGRADDTKA